MLFEDLLDHPATVFGTGHVALVDARTSRAVEVTLELLEEHFGVIPVSAVPSGDRRTLACQAPHDSRADPTGPSSDEGNSSRELLTHQSRGLFDNGGADSHCASQAWPKNAGNSPSSARH